MNDVVELVFFSDWFIINMGDHLSPLDMMRLKQVSKFTNRYMTKIFIEQIILQQIDKRLRIALLDQYKFVMKHIILNKVVISGSFIIQCILDEYWEGSDIDMYSTYNSENKMAIFGDKYEEYEHNDKYENVLPIHSIINQKLKNGQKLQDIIMNTDIYMDDESEDDGVIPEKKCPKSQNKIDLDYFDNFKEYMLKSFDLDICKNMFSIVNGRPKLYIHHLNKIITKKESALNYNQPHKVYRRIQKYSARGFDFNCVNYNISNEQISPFLVYKQDKFGRLDKLTFLNQIYNPMDISTILYCWNGLIAGYIFDKNNLYEDMKYSQDYRKGMIPIYDLKDIFNSLLYNKGDIQSLCPCLCKLNIKHIHAKCDIHSECKIKTKIDIIMIIFDDLTDDLKLKYDELFETKIPETGFLKMNDVVIKNNKLVIFNLNDNVIEEDEAIPMEVDEQDDGEDEMDIN